jgi:hypothetical protein
MVHGTNFGVELIIKTDREIDYYNDLLKISIDIRQKLYEKNENSILVYKRNYFDKKFNKLEYCNEYLNALNDIKYDRLYVSRQTHPELFLYNDVKIYNNFIKNQDCEQSISQEELNNLKEELNVLETKFDLENIGKRRKYLINKIEIQNIIINFDYFQKVKEIEKKLTDIKLTEEENEVVNKILNHDLFKNDKVWFEFILCEEDY